MKVRTIERLEKISQMSVFTRSMMGVESIEKSYFWNGILMHLPFDKMFAHKSRENKKGMQYQKGVHSISLL